MKIKLLRVLILGIITVFLVSCKKVHEVETLTVSNIHKYITRNKTIEKGLVKLFGKPDKKVNDIIKVEKMYQEDNNIEGGVFDQLDEYTDYYQTEKYIKVSYTDGNRYDSCYIYYNKSLGLEYVRFYIKDGLVSSYKFGNITNKSVAKKDKYLRQIID